MKNGIIISLAGLLLLGGCVAGKKTGPSAPAEPLPANTPMVAYYDALRGQQPIFLAALEADRTSAPAVALAAAPAAPAGARPALPNLRNFVIVNGCSAGAEQCISPSLPAAATAQRAEDEGVAGREAGDEAAAGPGSGDSGGVVSKPEESAAAAPPPADVRLLAPSK
jgi:hypothetical protein